ncbi:MAG: 50S ribosomal protein L29 [Planctomycetota bacterium]|jgi:large subunit ribosomal protein L29
MKIQEARALNDEELSTELDRLRRHLFDLRAQRVTEKLEDPTLVTKSRRDIARVLMVMRERELAAVRQGEASEA